MKKLFIALAVLLSIASFGRIKNERTFSEVPTHLDLKGNSEITDVTGFKSHVLFDDQIIKGPAEPVRTECFKGKLASASSACVGGNNYFTFIPPSTDPIIFSEPGLQFNWAVSDANGNPVPFVPVYLSGSSIPTYINVNFPSDGSYNISLGIASDRCRSSFTLKVDVRGCECRNQDGNVTLKEKKACVNEELSLSFGQPQQGYSYHWSIVNSQLDTVLEMSTTDPTLQTIISQTGVYNALLTITDKEGCKYLFIYSFTVENCKDSCVLGVVTNSNLCAGGNNYFYFIPDPSTPFDLTAPDTVYQWTVTDNNGNPVSYNPVFLPGTNLVYYINVPFNYPGEYTIEIVVNVGKCHEKFTKIVQVEDCRCRQVEGDIFVKPEKVCYGKDFTLQFSNPSTDYLYEWSIVNSDFQTVYNLTGVQSSITTSFTHTGAYVAFLTITDKEGCQTVFSVVFNVENCAGACYLGNLAYSNLCADVANYFHFAPDPSTPIDFSDPGLDFIWTVTDGSGNPVTFDPVFLFGSSLAYYINVIFPGEGTYTVTLEINTKDCRETFQTQVYVPRCDCTLKGDIKVNGGDTVCIGEVINLEFTNPQLGYIYQWQVINENYQVVYSNTGTSPIASTTLNSVGSYTLILTVNSQDGCQSVFLYNFESEDCQINSGDCFYHLGFSFATPNGGPLDNNKRLSMAKGIVDFVNQNTDGKLFMTTMDDHYYGTRFSAKQSNVSSTWITPVVNSSNEVITFTTIGNAVRMRVQNDNYSNTITKELNALAGTADLTMPMNINFVVASKDSNTSDLISAYNTLLSSGKAEKIYFILFEGGTNVLNGQSLTAPDFINQITGSAPVSYTQTGSVLNSNYLIVPSAQQNSNLQSYFKNFLQGAYNEVKGSVECPDCLNGEISNGPNLCAGTDNAFWFNPLGTIDFSDPQLNFSWTVTSNGNSVPFELPGGNGTAINIPFAPPGNYTITLVASNATCDRTYVKNVTIAACNTGTCGNPVNQNYVIGLFKSLLSHLKSQPAGSITNNYTCPELTALLPYLNPAITSPAIFNFTNTNNTISFSFTSNASSPHVVLKVPATNPSFLVALHFGGAYTNMNNQTGFLANYFSFSGIIPQFVTLTGSSVSQINFCPTVLNCVNHIAIVLDESTSITSVDAGRIRRQLKNFIDQQVDFNQTEGSQLRVSLIGLSDEDNDYNRTDHKMNILVNAANRPQLINWINKYKNRYNHGVPGVSSNSDFWNSGLARAAATDASLVILITDGAQTNNLTQLKNTIGLFNNGGNTASDKHLYVIGLNNGFYIDGDTPAGRLSGTTNPNHIVEHSSEDDEVSLSVEDLPAAGRLTDFLRISLRYLIYENTQFPTESLYNFSADYSGHTNFKFLFDNPYYLSNNLYKFLGQTCGREQTLEDCDDCFGVQLDPGKSYVVSAWVHVDKTQQVKSFNEGATQTPQIAIHFCNENHIAAEEDDPTLLNTQVLDPIEENNIVLYPGQYTFYPQGNIIDGWQRVFGVFKVHPNTVYLKIILNNNSVSDAMHFDDIRIHPLEGSMKSFVYDENNYRLMSELDENNYSTYYEYDAEGGLVRVKKETERGIRTIQESRSGTTINQN